MTGQPLTPETAYQQMTTIRRFEEEVQRLSLSGEVVGSVHLCLGQEAIPVGAVAALSPNDRILATYRGHGWALASGAPAGRVMAEIAHRASGTNGGRAGSAMLSWVPGGFLGENSIVGAGVPIAAGVALGQRRRGDSGITVVSLGDGAMNQGGTLEGIAFAAARALGLVVICENNTWSEMTPTSSMVATNDLATRVAGFGVRTWSVDGDDPLAVHEVVAAAAAHARSGAGPAFVECHTHRLKGHYNRDIEHYRPASDRQAAADADAVSRLAQSGKLTPAMVEEADARAETTVTNAVEFALSSPTPSPEDADTHVVSAPSPQVANRVGPTEELTMQRAINVALGAELEARDDVIVYGEDVGIPGGIFGVTRGLHKRFGGERVFDTPIAESAILGSAVGASIVGLRPVVEIMWADFMFVAFDQIINQASNVRYINRGELTAPLTIRTQQGATPGSCAQHSQNVEALLAHIPGIRVGLPSTPQDGYDMLRASVACDDPVVLIEHRAQYQSTGPVQTSTNAESAEGARLRRSGTDAVIISWGALVDDALAASDQLSAQGLSVGVLDLRWLRPLDTAAIDAAVKAAGGVAVVAHQAVRHGGFGAEVAAGIQERSRGRVTIRRVAGAESRIPASPHLQAELLPSANTVVSAVVEAVTAQRAASQ